MLTCKGKSNLFCMSNSKHEYHLLEIAKGDEKNETFPASLVSLHQEKLGIENLKDYFCARKLFRCSKLQNYILTNIHPATLHRVYQNVNFYFQQI